MTTVDLDIEGMTCEHCQKAVKTALEGVAGVESVTVSLAEKKAQVIGSMTEATALVAAVVEEGFQARVV